MDFPIKAQNFERLWAGSLLPGERAGLRGGKRFPNQPGQGEGRNDVGTGKKFFEEVKPCSE